MKTSKKMNLVTNIDKLLKLRRMLTKEGIPSSHPATSNSFRRNTNKRNQFNSRIRLRDRSGLKSLGSRNHPLSRPSRKHLSREESKNSQFTDKFHRSSSSLNNQLFTNNSRCKWFHSNNSSCLLSNQSDMLLHSSLRDQFIRHLSQLFLRISLCHLLNQWRDHQSGINITVRYHHIKANHSLIDNLQSKWALSTLQMSLTTHTASLLPDSNPEETTQN